VTGTITWNGTIATFTPSSLDFNGVYVVNVVGKDLAGNAFAASWTFNTPVAGDIEGILLDEDGNAIANANVTLSNGLTTTSDANGHFVFEDIAIGSYNVTVDADGFESVIVNATSEAGISDDLGELTMVDTDSDSDSSMLLIVAAIIGIAAIAAVAVLLLRKKP
jgi:hypothetical protein